MAAEPKARARGLSQAALADSTDNQPLQPPAGRFHGGMEAETLVEALQRAIDARRQSVLELSSAAAALETTKSHVRAAKVSGAVGTTAGSIATVIGTFALVGAAAATPIGWAGLGVGVAGTMVGVGASVAENAVGQSKLKRLREVMELDAAELDRLVSKIACTAKAGESGLSDELMQDLIAFSRAVLSAKQAVLLADQAKADEAARSASAKTTIRDYFRRRPATADVPANPHAVADRTAADATDTVAVGPGAGAGAGAGPTMHDLNLVTGDSSTLANAGGAAAGVAGGVSKASTLTHVGGHMGTLGSSSLIPMQALSTAASAVFLPWELYKLTTASLDMHHNQPPKAAESIRGIAAACELELAQLEGFMLSLWVTSTGSG